MTERSYYWEGTTIGDATLAPSSSNIYMKLWKILFSKEDNQGVIEGYTNELLVSGISGSVEAVSGAALVAGTFYESNETVTVTIPTPVTNPRIDRIVLQKIWSGATVRIARVTGTENASPTAPALTQTDEVQWEIPLAQVLVTTAGVITVTDEREFARTPLGVVGATVKIETITSDGSLSKIDFQNIPQIYKHLFIIGQILNTPVDPRTAILLNGDTAFASYNSDRLFGRSNDPPFSRATLAEFLLIDTRVFGDVPDERGTQIEVKISNYRGTTFYKHITKNEITIVDNTPIISDWHTDIRSIIWLNTEAIHRVTLLPIAGGVLRAGSQATLYAIR